MGKNSEKHSDEKKKHDKHETEEAVEETTAETAPEVEILPEEKADDADEKHAAELAAVKDQLLRTIAEYDNHRKRSAKEKLELRADIVSNVVSDFLPVMDNVQRAIDAPCTDENYKTGVQMIYDSFMETLKKLGVEAIESDGQQFDPTMHQAVQRIDDENAESGTVVKTFAKGFKIGDKVIRFAIVAVAN